jgi:hypothetical protein
MGPKGDDVSQSCEGDARGENLRFSKASRVGEHRDSHGLIEDQSLPRSASRGGTLHEMIRSIVRQHLGPQPQWYLTERIDNSTISFTTFITSDVLYSLPSKGCKTTFDVRVADLPPNRSVRYH